jgi:hypothetical protein
MIAPLQLICGLASETVAPAGFAPRVIGMIKIETTATNKQSGAATASLDRLSFEIAHSFWLNIFTGSPFLALANFSFGK